MGISRFAASAGPTSWLRAWTAAVAVVVLLAALPAVSFDVPELRAIVVAVGALVALVLSLRSLKVARASGVVEAAVAASFVATMSLLALSHAVVVWRAGEGATTGATASLQLVVPLGALALVPLVSPTSRLGNRLAARWEPLIGVHFDFVCAVAALLMIAGTALEPELPMTLSALLLAAATVAPATAFSVDRANLGARLEEPLLGRLAIGVMLVAATPHAWVLVGAAELTTFVAELLLVVGLVLAASATSFGTVRGGSLAMLLDPLEVEVPGRTIELANEALLLDYSARLDAGEKRTRDHIVRTTRLAVTVARELDLSPDVIRRVAMVAMFHDIGKDDIDAELLARREHLTTAEIERVMGHTERGAAIVATSPVFAEAAPGVRSHHERVDGHGGPDGLDGDATPIEARIVAACDAYDAMASSRRFRRGAPRAHLLSILREHGRTQWDAEVVGALSRVVRRHPDVAPPGTISPPGDPGADDLCCPDAVPGALGPNLDDAAPDQLPSIKASADSD